MDCDPRTPARGELIETYLFHALEGVYAQAWPESLRDEGAPAERPYSAGSYQTLAARHLAADVRRFAHTIAEEPA